MAEGERSCVGVLAFLSVALVMASGCGPSPSAPAVPPPPSGPPPPPPSLQVWEMDRALLNQLGSYETVGDFKMRWPVGFRHLEYREPLSPGLTVFAREGTPRPNGGRPRLFIVTGKSPADQRDAALKQLLAARLKTEKKYNSSGDWQESAEQPGLINGLSAVKVGWEASLSWAPKKTHGAMYACASPSGSLLVATVMDSEPYCEQTLKLLTAAVLSVHSEEVRVAIAQELADWQPDANVLEEMGPYEELGDYEIRWPRFYRNYEDYQTRINWPGGMSVHFRSGPVQPPGIVPILAVFLREIPADARDTPLEQITDEVLSAMKEEMHFGADWQQSPVESGRINGLTFQRFAWQGNIANAPRKAHGYIYTARDGGVFLMFFCFGFEPHHDEALETCNASLMTFRKKQASGSE